MGYAESVTDRTWTEDPEDPAGQVGGCMYTMVLPLWRQIIPESSS